MHSKSQRKNRSLGKGDVFILSWYIQQRGGEGVARSGHERSRGEGGGDRRI